jgi:hypothetical protein
MCSGKECQLLKRGGQGKEIEMLLTVLPNVNMERTLSVKLDAVTEESF